MKLFGGATDRLKTLSDILSGIVSLQSTLRRNRVQLEYRLLSLESRIQQLEKVADYKVIERQRNFEAERKRIDEAAFAYEHFKRLELLESGVERPVGGGYRPGKKEVGVVASSRLLSSEKEEE